MQKKVIACLLLQTLTAMEVWAAEPAVPIKVAGTRVSLNPPEGFTPSTRFSGFVKKEASASIAVTEIKGPYDQVLSAFSKGELASRGLSLTASSVVPMGKNESLQASMIEYAQSAYGQKFKKVAFIFGDRNNTTIVTGAMPENGSATLFESLRQAALSAKFDPHAKISSLDEGLPFTIADTKRLKKASRMQNVLIYTPSGKQVNADENSALFAVGQSAGEVAVGDHETFARERLEHTPQVKNITIDKVRIIKQAGLEGVEFLAKAADATDGAPTFVYHAMLFDKNGYYIFQGLCRLSERATYEPEYQQLVKSFELR